MCAECRTAARRQLAIPAHELSRNAKRNRPWRSNLLRIEMHEVALMTEAVRLAVEAARAAGAQRVTALRLRVGALSGAAPEAMEFAWDVVRRGTLLADARLEIERVPAVGWCPNCRVEFDTTGCWSECPRCQEPAGELRRGRELEIASMELE